ncbi:MAG: PHB depolymerase family esterase, partial [Polyangiaceae bacterium]
MSGCSDDPPATTPPPDSGNPTTDTGTPGDNDGSTEDAGETIPPGDTRPCGGSTIAVGTTTDKLTHMGVEYGYIVHVPPSYDGTKRTPLIVNWHGANANGAAQQIYSQADQTSDAEGFIVVYPSSPDGVWAGGTCCAQFKDGGNPDRDDVGFARALVAHISSVACIDAKKVYSMGMSNGAFMSHRLACEAADQFAAVVSVAGKMGATPCMPSRPVPIIHFHGTADMTIPYEDPRFSAEGVSVPEMMANWAKRDGCTQGPDTTFQMGNATC